MGASSWSHVAPYEGDVAATLAALHQQVFHDAYGDGSGYANLDELWQDEEFMGECGTHTILDVYRLVDSTDPPYWRSGHDYNTMRPLAADRIRHWFGTDRPTRARYESLRSAQEKTFREAQGAAFLNRPKMLDDECQMRWTGVYIVLYSGDQPSDIAFWGYSGD
jgi:hypothetical protein